MMMIKWCAWHNLNSRENIHEILSLAALNFPTGLFYFSSKSLLFVNCSIIYRSTRISLIIFYSSGTFIPSYPSDDLHNIFLSCVSVFPSNTTYPPLNNNVLCVHKIPISFMFIRERDFVCYSPISYTLVRIQNICVPGNWVIMMDHIISQFSEIFTHY